MRVRRKLKYFLENWKMLIHLMFRTYHFGVNNLWWSPFRSMFGLPFHKRFRLIRQYRHARFRACACHFVGPEEQRLLFPKHTDYGEGDD